MRGKLSCGISSGIVRRLAWGVGSAPRARKVRVGEETKIDESTLNEGPLFAFCGNR